MFDGTSMNGESVIGGPDDRIPNLPRGVFNVDNNTPNEIITPDVDMLLNTPWEDVVENGVQIEAATDWLTDRAWDVADGAGKAVESVVEGGKNAAYLGGRTVLGAGKLGENAVKAAVSGAKYVIGDKNGAVEAAQTSVVDGLADNLGDALQVDDTMKDIGDKAEIVGEVATGIGVSIVTPAGIATGASEAVFAFGAAGDVIESQAADGELNDMEMAGAAATGLASAAFATAADKVASKAASAIEKSKMFKELSNAIKNTVGDLKSFSDIPDTITEKAFKLDDLRIEPPEVVGIARKEFKSIKSDLIKQWEVANEREWPRYTHDVYNEAGKLIRKAGSLFDAHHIQPLKLGGENIVENITPMHANVHYNHTGIHAADGPYKAIFELLGEVNG